MSEDKSTASTAVTTSTSSVDNSHKVKRDMEIENTQAVHSLLIMSANHLVREPRPAKPSLQFTVTSHNVHSSAPSECITSKLIKREAAFDTNRSDKVTIETYTRKQENIDSSLTSDDVNPDEGQKRKECSESQTITGPETTDRDTETFTGDLAVLTRQVESNAVIVKACPASSQINMKDISKLGSVSHQLEKLNSTPTTMNRTTISSVSWSGQPQSSSFSYSQAAFTDEQCTKSENVHMERTNKQSNNVSNKGNATFSHLEKSDKTLECSFTDSDDSDVDNPKKSKRDDDDVFRITFDSDDTKSFSEDGTFLTCSICGKEVPETIAAEGGKEMCNTCKLVRNEPEEIKPKAKRGRKKAVEAAMTENMETITPVKKTQKKVNMHSEELDTLMPVRKSTRKRISTIVIEEIVQDSDDEIESGAADNTDQDADYTQVQRKPKVSLKTERKAKTENVISKSKYAQELNLTPVVKHDLDMKDDVIITDPEDQSQNVISSEEILSNRPSLNNGNVKRKKGRPKGSKNKPKVSREFSAAGKEPKRDMKFNKRWHRGRGPVPDANPDAADGMWSCEFCGKAFPIRRNFLAHRRKHSGRHKCDECGEAFECNSKLQRHIRRHRGEKPFACHLCPKAYSENMWLQRHLATHLAEGHAPQPKPYQCNICGRQYTHKGTMIYHVKTHTETKFYQCDVCGKQFTHRSSLECHIKTHTGEKPFVCEICGKRFADRSVQLRHTRSHSGEKPYKCTICEKGFTQSGTLNIHMRMHTSEKPYKCKVCEMGFMKRCDLSKHSKCHVGEMLTKQANLITCRVSEGRGADIQKKAAQILIDAYGEKKEDGTIEIKTRQFEQPMESDPEEISENDGGGEVSGLVKSVDLPVEPHPMDIHLMRRPDPVISDHHQLQHEDIQRRAMEFILMKRQELEQQQEIERMQLVHQPMERSSMEHVTIDRQIIDHQTVEVVTEQHPADRQMVEQQIERHVEQHAVQRQLLEQVESQVLEQHVIEGQQIESQRLEHVEQMSPQQQALWICKYN